MKCCKCPKCKNKQELYPRKLADMINLNSVKRFICDSCGFGTQIVAERQGKDRVVLFFAMSEVEDE